MWNIWQDDDKECHVTVDVGIFVLFLKKYEVGSWLPLPK